MMQAYKIRWADILYLNMNDGKIEVKKNNFVLALWSWFPKILK